MIYSTLLYNVCILTRKCTSGLINLNFKFSEAKLNLKRLGAEAAAGAIADILWKSQRRTNKVRLFGTY